MITEEESKASRKKHKLLMAIETSGCKSSAKCQSMSEGRCQKREEEEEEEEEEEGREGKFGGTPKGVA